ncbi:MAG: hypothetical protein K2G23_06380, partial [Muribaculaceae bacterium]|nr:hypothetical protein [Muribaculaceae bacterium]
EYTLFDVRKGDARRVLDALRHAEFYGQPVNAEMASDRDYSADARKKGKKGSSKDKPGKERGSREKRGEKRGDKKDEKKGRSKRVSYGGDPFALDIAPKKPKKEKKSKAEKAEKAEKKPKYNGNYDIFIKK